MTRLPKELREKLKWELSDGTARRGTFSRFCESFGLECAERGAKLMFEWCLEELKRERPSMPAEIIADWLEARRKEMEE